MIRKYHNHKPQTTPWYIKESGEILNELKSEDIHVTYATVINYLKDSSSSQSLAMGGSRKLRNMG